MSLHDICFDFKNLSFLFTAKCSSFNGKWHTATNLMISHNIEGVGYYRPPNVGVKDGSIFDRCRDVRRRSVRNPLTNAIPLLQRSKLGFPLSPETPAFMLDILIRKTWNCYLDEDDEERTVSLHVYDVTHRHTVDSDWLSRFTNILKGESQESTEKKEVDNDVISNIKQSETSSSEDAEEASCVTSVSVSQCLCLLLTNTYRVFRLYIISQFMASTCSPVICFYIRLLC